MKTDAVHVAPLYRNNRPEIAIVGMLHPDKRAQLATMLIERWGMIAAEPDGEDSAGRQRMKLQSPAEIVARACETAEHAYHAFQDRGWLLKLPTPEEAEQQLKAGEEEDD